jgi:hypothetical protein
MTHLDIWNTSYGEKKGRKSNWQFDSRPLKVENRPDSLACGWCATYHSKAFNEGYNFALNFILFGGLYIKWYAPKVTEVPTLGISGLRDGSPITKCHLGAGLGLGTKYTIRGKVVASLKSKLWWILWVRGCMWLVQTSKMLQLCSNQLVFGFVQVCVSSWCLSFFLVPSWNSIMLLYPQSVVSKGMCLDSLLFCCF